MNLLESHLVSLVSNFDLRTPIQDKVEGAGKFTKATIYLNKSRRLAHIVFPNELDVIIRCNVPPFAGKQTDHYVKIWCIARYGKYIN